MPTLAPKLPYDHPFAGGYPSLGSQSLPTDSDCLNYLSAVAAADGAGVEVGVAVAVDTFFRDTKAAGVFDALKACCILAGARTLAGALVPVVGDAPTNVADGFVEGDYSRTDGLTGDGSTTYLDSGRLRTADPQDDYSLCVYATALESRAVTAFYCGAGDEGGTPNAFSHLGRQSGGDHFTRNTAATAYVHTGAAVGFFGTSRVSADSFQSRQDGATSSTSVTSQTTFATTAKIFAGRISVGSLNAPTDATIAFYSIGTSLNLEALDAAVTNLITAIGEAL